MHTVQLVHCDLKNIFLALLGQVMFITSKTTTFHDQFVSIAAYSPKAKSQSGTGGAPASVWVAIAAISAPKLCRPQRFPHLPAALRMDSCRLPRQLLLISVYADSVFFKPCQCFKPQCHNAGPALNQNRVAAGRARETDMHSCLPCPRWPLVFSVSPLLLR